MTARKNVFVASALNVHEPINLYSITCGLN